jgi:DNA-binding CsgD family transcriptional regulator
VLVVDDEGVLIEASLGACRLLGVARADVVGRRIESLFEPESSERFAATWPTLRTGGSPDPGSFALEAPASVVEVGLMVTARILPSRHLVAFEPVGAAERQRGAPRVGLRAVREPSAREREVLALLAEGATDGQIAARLDLSPATVQTHVRNAKAKLGARTRAQAVAMALRRGLIGSS